MAGIKITIFGGVQPATAARLLPPHAAQIAENCKLWYGDLRPWRAPLSILTPSKPGTKKSIYRFGQDVANEAQYWFHWTTDVDVAPGPIAGDASERTYFTGDGVPKVTDSSIALVGGTDYPMASYTLGLPSPANTPSATPGGGGSGTARTISYVYTYVTAWGEEGPPSLPSTAVSTLNGQSVTVGNMSTGPGAGYNVVSKRIYRTVTGNNTVDFRFIAEIAVATTSYADTTLDSAAVLNEALPSAEWAAPPTDMAGLIAVENGMLAGFSKKDVCVCEAFIPSAWPVRYRKTAHWKVVGLGPIAQGFVACTKGRPYVARGVHPSALSWDKVDVGKACVAKRSIAAVGGVGVMYASPTGMALVSLAGSSVVTEPLMTRDEWQALVPESMNGYEYNGRYVGFYDTGSLQAGFIIDPKNQHAPLTFTNVYATAGYNDPIRDTLYLQIGNDIKRWDGDPNNNLTYTWRSSIVVPTKPVSPSWGQVEAAAYPVTCKVYADGALKHTETVANANPFRMPKIDKAREFEIEIIGTRHVKSAHLAETIEALRAQ